MRRTKSCRWAHDARDLGPIGRNVQEGTARGASCKPPISGCPKRTTRASAGLRYHTARAAIAAASIAIVASGATRFHNGRRASTATPEPWQSSDADQTQRRILEHDSRLADVAQALSRITFQAAGEQLSQGGR